MKDRPKEFSVSELARLLNTSEDVIRSLGVHASKVQLASIYISKDVTRCDADSGQSGQYTGDLEVDLKKYFN